jgi:hypothetical protein
VCQLVRRLSALTQWFVNSTRLFHAATDYVNGFTHRCSDRLCRPAGGELERSVRTRWACVATHRSGKTTYALGVFARAFSDSTRPLDNQHASERPHVVRVGSLLAPPAHAHATAERRIARGGRRDETVRQLLLGAVWPLAAPHRPHSFARRVHPCLERLRESLGRVLARVERSHALPSCGHPLSTVVDG